MARYVYGLDIAWCTGIAIYDIDTNQFVYVSSIDANKITRTSKEKKANILEHGKRLKYISNEFEKIIKMFPPEYVFIERYFSRFANATVALAKIHGVFNKMLADVPSIYYPPKTVKEALLNGNATKVALKNIINEKYNYLSFTNEDESDAVAICITGLIKNNLIDWKKPGEE